MLIMHEKTNNPEPSPESCQRGYEVGDLNIRNAAKFLPYFVAFMVLTLVFLWFLQKRMMQRTTGEDRQRSVIQRTQKLSDAPPLQPMQRHDFSPRDDLMWMYKDENQLFQSLGWKVDPKTLMAQPPDELVEQVINRTNARREGGPARGAPAPVGRPETVTPVPKVDQGGKP